MIELKKKQKLQEKRRFIIRRLRELGILPDDKEYMNDIVYPTIGLILTVSVILLLAIKSLA